MASVKVLSLKHLSLNGLDLKALMPKDYASLVKTTKQPYVFELKATVKMDLPQFWREACVEAANYAKARSLDVVPPAYVIVKRRMAGLEQSWVIQDLEQWLRVTNGI